MARPDRGKETERATKNLSALAQAAEQATRALGGQRLATGRNNLGAQNKTASTTETSPNLTKRILLGGLAIGAAFAGRQAIQAGNQALNTDASFTDALSANLASQFAQVLPGEKNREVRNNLAALKLASERFKAQFAPQIFRGGIEFAEGGGLSAQLEYDQQRAKKEIEFRQKIDTRVINETNRITSGLNVSAQDIILRTMLEQNRILNRILEKIGAKGPGGRK